MTEEEKRQYQNAWSRKRYRSRKEQGLCVDCGKAKAIPGKLLCASCKAKRSEYEKENRKFYQSIGICPVCRKHSIYGDEKICLGCAARRRGYKYNRSDVSRAKQKQHYEQAKARHVCPSCGKPAAPGKVRCYQCLDKNRRKVGEKRTQTIMIQASWQNDNACIRCGKPVRPGTSFCEYHYKKSLMALTIAREKQKSGRTYAN